MVNRAQRRSPQVLHEPAMRPDGVAETIISTAKSTGKNGQLLISSAIFSGKSKATYENIQTVDTGTKILHFSTK